MESPDTTQLPPLPPNESMMTREQIEAVREREYPKWMYHPTEEALKVASARVEATLGMDWKEEPYATVEDDGNVEVPKTREEYYRLGQNDALAMVAVVTDAKALATMLTSEHAHPRRAGGRPAVLEAIGARITDMEIEAAPKVKRKVVPATA